MIRAIEGVISAKTPAEVVIKTAGGVSYGINISLNCAQKIENSGKLELFITQILREDTDNLYGFLDKKEQKMFEMLIKLNGIGPSTALGVCSSLSSDDFVKAVINGDFAVLTSVPGIGAKTARRIVAELSDAKLIGDEIPTYKNDALLALESLGFKRDKINKILPQCQSQTTPELIKEALKKLA